MYTRNLLRVTGGVSSITIGRVSTLVGVYLAHYVRAAASRDAMMSSQVGLVDRGVIFSTAAEYPSLLAALGVGIVTGLTPEVVVGSNQYFPMNIPLFEGDNVYFRVAHDNAPGTEARSWMILYLEPKD